MQTAEFIDKSLSVLGDSRSDAVGEAALLFAWKKISEGEPGTATAYPPLSDVIKGKRSLAEVYQLLSEKLDWENSAYASSRLPERFPSARLVDIIIELDSLSDFTPGTAVNQLYLKRGDDHEARLALPLPESLILLMVKLVVLDEKPVYAPFLPSLQLAVEASFQGSTALLEASEWPPLAEALSILTDIKVVKHSAVLKPLSGRPGGKVQRFANVLMVPPFGRTIKSENAKFGADPKGEAAAIDHGLDRCDGRMVVLVSQGILFRGAEDRSLRIKLVEKGYLEAVIQFPALLRHTSINVSLLIIDKSRDTDSPILFYNADQEELINSGERGISPTLKSWERIAKGILKFKGAITVRGENLSRGKLVSREEIKSNNYDLSASRYVFGTATKSIHELSIIVSLESVSELIRGQLLKQNDPPEGEFYFEVGVKDIAVNGVISQPGKKLQLTGNMQNRAELQQLHPGDILLTTKGRVGKVGFVGDDCGDNWVASQSFQIIRLGIDSRILPEYLYHYLSSPLVQTYFAEQTTGAVISVLKTDDIKSLPIPVMNSQEQDQVVATHKKIMEQYQNIKALENEIEILRQSHWPLADI